MENTWHTFLDIYVMPIFIKYPLFFSYSHVNMTTLIKAPIMVPLNLTNSYLNSKIVAT